MGKVEYISVQQAAGNWHISERSVRNYCSLGRIEGALIEGGIWKIPSDAQKPARKIRHAVKKETLLDVLKREKDSSLSGGIYHKIQIDLTYNSNHIEGSHLTHDQTRYIFETRTIGVTDKAVKVDDIIETANHFRGIDLIIERAKTKLTESFIKQLHFILKTG
ncbi:MAG: cell filamentation protein Fic, partial [Treponema sp.]|nr:cell filamentation protein Fic [Treponema sp.]